MTNHQLARQGWRGSASMIALSLSLLAACTSVSVDRDVGATERLPAPDRVLVYNFAITPQEVQRDAIGSAITSTLDGTADSQQETQVGHAVADALAKRLVSDIQNMGLYAERAAGPVPPTGIDVLILGQLVSIDEGNAAERMIIGLGAGRSDVEAHLQVCQSTSGRRIPIETMSGAAKSSLMPGAAETVRVGALTGYVLGRAAITAGSQVANQTLSANVNARRCHDQL